MAKRIGKQTIKLDKNIIIAGSAGVVGKKEGEGPLGDEFDMVFDDEYLGQPTFEAAESMLIKNACLTACKKADIQISDIDLICVGDLLDQSMSSTYGIKDFSVPHIGLFGACSTSGLSTALSSVLIDSGAVNLALAATSSHFCTAERQFRFPLEYGSKRTPNSQRTVTGSGAFVLKEGSGKPKINSVTFGKIKDYDITDANNMGAAMAPAAADTIKAFLDDTDTTPNDFDLILTGDLGKIGSKLLIELLEKENIDISTVHNDCGLMIFDINDKDIAAGGSGCGCSASVFATNIMNKLNSGEIKRMLFIPTGALLSPTSTNQGLSIPGIAHLIEIVAS